MLRSILSQSWHRRTQVHLLRHGCRRWNSQLPYNAVHTPVMLSEVLTYLAPRAGNTYCDLTFGDGGYTKAILDACDCKVVAVDQDPTAYEKALAMASLHQYSGRLFPVLGRFGNIAELVRSQLSLTLPCFDGLVMDIGVSSGQLETASRGFSYKLEGPLDMRMFSRGRNNTDINERFEAEAQLLSKSISAYEVVNYLSQEQIADIIYQYGGDRLSRKIASAIVTARQKEPIETTIHLASIIHKASPQPRWKRGDDDMLRNSAARTFQAFRIYVNNELGELESALRASEYLLQPGGKLVAVTFHSLEDRIVKTFLNHGAGKRLAQDASVHQFRLKRAAYRQRQKAARNADFEAIDYSSPVTRDVQGDPSFQLSTKGVVLPSPHEREHNARSRSAKLRAAIRTPSPPLCPFGPLTLDGMNE